VVDTLVPQEPREVPAICDQPRQRDPGVLGDVEDHARPESEGRGRRLGVWHLATPESEGRRGVGGERRGGPSSAERRWLAETTTPGSPEPPAGWERAACPPARRRREGAFVGGAEAAREAGVKASRRAGERRAGGETAGEGEPANGERETRLGVTVKAPREWG
jgi:hypothetical protein